MGISPDRLCLALVPLNGFTVDIIQVMGAITLSVLAGEAPKAIANMVDFQVVKAPSSYNAILESPTLKSLRVVTSTYYLKMKFCMDLGIGEVCSEQVLTRECYT